MKLVSLFIAVFLFQSSYADNTDIIDEIKPIQQQWAIIKYKMVDSNKANAYENLAIRAKQLAQQYPDRAEPLIWEAIIISSYAGAVGGIKSITRALPAVKTARELLHKAQQMDPTALQGSVYTSLGALYYQVPGWPIGFGDKKQARYFLEKAMTDFPNKLETGYFYGDFLIQQHEYSKAREVLENALKTPALSDRPLADQGRRQEIRALLEIDKLSDKS